MPKRPIIGEITTADGRQLPVRAPTARAAKAALRPYVVELGYLATAWNRLHQNLSSLFSLLLHPIANTTSQAIWHSTDSDFTQRKMLRAMLDSIKAAPPEQRLERQIKEMSWILDQIEEKLRHRRNNALHAPLMVVSAVADNKAKKWVEAHFNPQNPRARPLRGKDLIGEFKDYTAHTEVLARYAVQIWNSLNSRGRHPWPKRPLLPQAHKEKQKSRQGRRQPRKPLPEA
jgi:hypothetical protein